MSDDSSRTMDSFGVIFDVDGVLVDSYQLHFDSWRVSAKRRGWEMTEEMFSSTFGQTSQTVIRKCWSDANVTEQEMSEFDDEKEELYRQMILESFPEMRGAKQLICQLHDAGIPMAVGSSGPRPNIMTALQFVDPNGHIRAVVSREDIQRSKPDPQVFQIAAQRLELPQPQCVVLEDAPVGVAAAHAAGSQCVGVLSTGRTREELSNAELLVNDLSELDVEKLRSLVSC